MPAGSGMNSASAAGGVCSAAGSTAISRAASHSIGAALGLASCRRVSEWRWSMPRRRSVMRADPIASQQGAYHNCFPSINTVAFSRSSHWRTAHSTATVGGRKNCVTSGGSVGGCEVRDEG